MIRVIFDTNVYLSGLFWAGNPRKCIALAKLNKIQTFISHEIIEEIRSKLRKKFDLSVKDSNFIVDTILSYTTMINPTQSLYVPLNDPDDQKFIDCALASNSHFIVSGDRHLLSLEKIFNFSILKPTEFLLKCHFLIQ